jgi:histidinol-phosphate aminotransferase
VTPRTKVVFIANPNNPTGTYIPAEELRRLRAGLRDDIVLVIDSAYAEYVTRNDYTPGTELVDQGVNTVMTRTFSKIYALAALRIGWAYCPPAIYDVLERLRAPFNISTAAQAAGKAAMEDAEHIAASRDHNSVWLPWMTERFREAGLHVQPSVANFVLVRFPDDPARNAQAAFEFFGSRGIIARETGGYFLPGWLRFTIGREDEMRAVAQAARDFMAGTR